MSTLANDVQNVVQYCASGRSSKALPDVRLDSKPADILNEVELGEMFVQLNGRYEIQISESDFNLKTLTVQDLVRYIEKNSSVLD